MNPNRQPPHYYVVDRIKTLIYTEIGMSRLSSYELIMLNSHEYCMEAVAVRDALLNILEMIQIPDEEVLTVVKSLQHLATQAKTEGLEDTSTIVSKLADKLKTEYETTRPQRSVK